MAEINEAQLRAEFEAWLLSNSHERPHLGRWSTGEYSSFTIHERWQAYQAAATRHHAAGVREGMEWATGIVAKNKDAENANVLAAMRDGDESAADGLKATAWVLGVVEADIRAAMPEASP